MAQGNQGKPGKNVLLRKNLENLENFGFCQIKRKLRGIFCLCSECIPLGDRFWYYVYDIQSVLFHSSQNLLQFTFMIT